MKWNSKKIWPSVALSLVAGSSLLNADNGDARTRNLENRVTALESRNNCCAIVNPPARPFAKDCWGFYVAIDPLLWQAHENGLPLAIQTNGSTSFSGNPAANKVKNLNFHWDWGFRLIAGLNLDYDGWDTNVAWTRWHTDASKHTSASSTNILFPSVGHPSYVGATTSGQLDSHWKLHFNQLDWEVGREFFVSKWLTLRPFGGLRSAWINQKLRTTFSTLATPSATLSGKASYQNNNHSNYWGIGLLGGLNTLWGLGCGWGVFADFSASLLYGFFSLDCDEYSFDTAGIRTIIDRNDNFYHVGRAITDMDIGLRYDWLSCDECYHLGFELGWEHHMFFGQNQFMNFADDVMRGKFFANQGDLTTQGYFARVRFDF